ncbi:unnamed protein product, partial [Ceratitis capitata]
ASDLYAWLRTKCSPTHIQVQIHARLETYVCIYFHASKMNLQHCNIGWLISAFGILNAKAPNAKSQKLANIAATAFVATLQE